MADETSKNGVYIDNATGRVVDTPPVEGVQLVAPGGVVDDNAKRLIEAAASAQPADKPPAPATAPAKAVTTTTLRGGK